jgi:hypothetical protein
MLPLLALPLVVLVMRLPRSDCPRTLASAHSRHDAATSHARPSVRIFCFAKKNDRGGVLLWVCYLLGNHFFFFFFFLK